MQQKSYRRVSVIIDHYQGAYLHSNIYKRSTHINISKILNINFKKKEKKITNEILSKYNAQKSIFGSDVTGLSADNYFKAEFENFFYQKLT